MSEASLTKPLRIIFAGTPEFAAAHLRALLSSHHQVIAVYTQPDRPAGRGKKLTPSPVKVVAESVGLPVYQPLSLKDVDAQAELAALNADIMVVVAYGLLLPKPVLDAPRLGCINVHGSLLPRWRGAAPIQRAIEAGDSESGVTIMQMDIGLDTGDMLLKSSCPILPTDTASDLHDRLIELGCPALLDALDKISSGIISAEKQDDSLSNYAPKLLKDEAMLDWQQSAAYLERKIRAFNPFPMAFTQLANSGAENRIRVLNAQLAEGTTQATAGQVVAVSDLGVDVATLEGVLRLTQLQLPGKKAMSVSEILRGNSDFLAIGDQLELPRS